MTPAVSLSLLLQGRHREHLLAGPITRYYYKFLKVETHEEKHFTFSCLKTAKVDLNFTSVYDALQKDFCLHPRGSLFFLFRDQYTDPHKGCRQFSPLLKVSAFQVS